MKHVLEKRNPLMLLDKAIFEDMIAHEKGDKMGNRHTVSVGVAFLRLATLYPELNQEKLQLSEIIRDRNFLVHQAGHYDLNKIEGKVRVNVTGITEAIIIECLGKSPEEVLGKVLWREMETYKKTYEKDEALELQKRIALFKRMYSKGEKLPCDDVGFSGGDIFDDIECPVCENIAEYEISLDAEHDYDGHAVGGGHFFSLLRCTCGFVLTDHYEIEMVVGERAEKVLAEMYSDYEPDEDYFRGER